MESRDDELRESDRTKTRPVTSAANERSPPATIPKSHLETLLTDLSAGLDERQLSFLRVGLGSAAKLEKLAFDLLDLATLESGKISLDIRPHSSGRS